VPPASEPPASCPHWYCVKTGPKREAFAAAQVAAAPGVVEVFAPRIRFRKATRRGPVWFVEALFPGYLFARFPYPECHRFVRSCGGVSGIVHFGDRVPVLPDEHIAALKAGCPNSETVLEPELRAGDEIRIAAGSLSGLEAVVAAPMPARDRVRILIEFLGQLRPVEIERDRVVHPTPRRALRNP
jgi:transcriptional antiterminator RfaH